METMRLSEICGESGHVQFLWILPDLSLSVTPLIIVSPGYEISLRKKDFVEWVCTVDGQDQRLNEVSQSLLELQSEHADSSRMVVGLQSQVLQLKDQNTLLKAQKGMLHYTGAIACFLSVEQKCGMM